MRVRQATTGDIPAVVEISRRLNDNLWDDPGQGFLVSGLTQADYESLVGDADIFLVADGPQGVAGYLFGFLTSNPAASGAVNQLIGASFFEEVFIIKQVGVAPEYARQGIAERLFFEVFQVFSNHTLASVVVVDPLNHASLAFHQKHGFQHFLDVNPPADTDGQVRQRAVWVRLPEGADFATRSLLWPRSDSMDVFLLVERQHDLVSLYQHEDNLNWTKFGHLVSYILAHTAGIGFLMNFSRGAGVLDFHVVGALLALGLSGFLLIFLFHRKLASGVAYMAVHKENIKYLDGILKREAPFIPRCVAGVFRSAKSKRSKPVDIAATSSTVNILSKVTIVVAVMWGVITFGSLSYVASLLGWLGT